ncbi:MFS transporter [Variovorax dokdonensis]|uniref:MFS transporter n=1 Tax=Variovorax dokdonensis TaxID=344883 RepID=A0ABT7NAK2_9BURK|nr:MFS transporter [Variovorax dokdonensis]MDM0044972.1 MFS transporter [Variovorax dokdonensis]
MSTHAPPISVEPAARISLSLLVCLGLSQVVGWGTLHYLIGLFAAPIERELGWSPTFVQGGFSLALVIMGLASYRVGAWIDRHGGRAAMMMGCWLGAAGCLLLAGAHGKTQFVVAWVFIGLAMRLALYDSAFASLAHVAGTGAKRHIAFITLFGGFASTVFWPLGQAMADAWGWRGALVAYAVLLALSSLLHLALPASRHRRENDKASAQDASGARAGTAGTPTAPVQGAYLLFAVIALTVLFLQTAMAAQFLELLRGRGWDAATAVTLSMLLGLGQFAGRFSVALWAHRVDAVRLNLMPGAYLCLAFACYLTVGRTLWGAGAFAFLYGAGNGLATITRGAMPLVIFDASAYGRTVGAVLRPAFALAATAPMVFAFVVAQAGHTVAAVAALAISATTLAASVLLYLRVRPGRVAH